MTTTRWNSGRVTFGSKDKHAWRAIAACCIGACLGGILSATPAMAQTAGETVLYAFQGGADGENPQTGLVVGTGGVLYGTTYAGGGGDCVPYWSQGGVIAGCGTIFELVPPTTSGGAWTEKILYAFTGGADGAYPNSLVLGTNGTLYGTAGGGGTGATAGSGNGVLFELLPPKTAGGAWREGVLYDFCKQASCADGSSPGDGLIVANGALYGATPYGGANGDGVVFKYTLATSTTSAKYAVLYSFKGGSDGAFPFSSPIMSKSGTLYGVTNGGGGGTLCSDPNGCGTAYELAPGSGAYAETVIHAFTGGSDGANPGGHFNLLSSGTLVGSAGGGTTGYGIVYELAPPTTSGGAWTETVLTNFGEANIYGIPDGSFPNGNMVVGGNGSIYGATYGGGEPNNAFGYFFPGTLFEITPPFETGGAWVRSMLYTFQAGTDGAQPGWGVIADGDTLVGTTGVGGGTGCPAQGNFGCGTVFQYTP